MPRPYEGRIRPSLIAAGSGIPSLSHASTPTRGEFAPPSLRLVLLMKRPLRSPLRGANSPLPHCGVLTSHEGQWQAHSTRGEFAPPSLRHLVAEVGCAHYLIYEGRIRPSLIAAASRTWILKEAVPLRGANSPLPHCGPGLINERIYTIGVYEGRIRPSLIAARRRASGRDRDTGLRGANSPLPHCGSHSALHFTTGSGPTRGEFAPPSLRPCNRHLHPTSAGAYEGRIRPSLIAASAWYSDQRMLLPTRGEFAPPSLRRVAPAVVPGDSRRLRGANSPLPHCGVRDLEGNYPEPPATRGEFAPPSLRHPTRNARFRRRADYEGRIRPSLIAAFFPYYPTERRRRPTRGEFAPPSLRHEQVSGVARSAERLRGANSPLPHCGYSFIYRTT